MNVLVVNAGSSSLKFTLFNMVDESVIASGQVERIGVGPKLIYKRPGQESITEDITIADHTEALKSITDKLIDPAVGVLKSLNEIDAIGHRIVHGGEKISAPVLLTDAVKKIIEECFLLAPLHNPPNLAGVLASEKLCPNAKNIGVFDTAFHQTMKPEAYLYAIPYELYKQHGIRRYGFHGTSHRYVTAAASNFLGKKQEELKLITCHLGNGCSMAAIENGKVIDTTMGLTPIEGLMMGTRSGDIDAGAIFFMINGLGMNPQEVDHTLNKLSGLQGLIGVSDMRDSIAKAEAGDGLAQTALKMFVRRVLKYIGSYWVLLNGADAIVFTGGIGEYSCAIRAEILDGLRVFGITGDAEKNKMACGKAGVISADDSAVKVVVMPTNEELMIARQTLTVLKK